MRETNRKVASPRASIWDIEARCDPGHAVQDFAFRSGVTKSPPIPGRGSFLTPRFDLRLFAFAPFCEVRSLYFAAGDTFVGFGPCWSRPRAHHTIAFLFGRSDHRPFPWS
jgi:hypothetical protein